MTTSRREFSLLTRISRTVPRTALAGAAAAALLLTGCGADAENSADALVVGSDLTYPPYAFFDGETPAGFDPDITGALAEELGVEAQYSDTRFEQLIPGLKSGQFDVIASALYITAERAAEVDFVPYFSTGNSILVAGSGEGGPTDASELCGLTVGVIKGGDIVQRLREDASGECTAAGEDAIDVREFTTDPEATQAMLSGQLDAHVTDAAVAASLVDNDSVDVAITSTRILYPIPVGLAVQKGDAETKERLESALAKLQENGRYAELLGEYNLEEPDAEQVASILGS